MITMNRMLPAALLVMAVGSALSACTTLGDPGPAICHADDGTMVPVNDSKCPQSVRDALRRDAPPPQSIDTSINNDLYNAQNGLTAGDAGYR